jgi:hypothetical protein
MNEKKILINIITIVIIIYFCIYILYYTYIYQNICKNNELIYNNQNYDNLKKVYNNQNYNNLKKVYDNQNNNNQNYDNQNNNNQNYDNQIYNNQNYNNQNYNNQNNDNQNYNNQNNDNQNNDNQNNDNQNNDNIKENNINKEYIILNRCNKEYTNNLIELNKKTVDLRDYGVLYNDLYPPYGRTDRPISDNILKNMDSGLFNISTRDNIDTPRLLGYFYPDNNNNNIHHIYKLFGWVKYNGNSNGYFYFKSTDETKSFKYTLDDTNSNLRRIDDIPPIIKIYKGPIIGEFKFDELKKSDLSNRYM